jgi:hypothetical protein
MEGERQMEGIMKRLILLLFVLFCTFPAMATTWYVRSDGGTRYDAARVAAGMTAQCNGKYDAPNPGSGVNQNCAFNDYRFLYDDQTYGNSAWVISGGDTVIIRGGPWQVGFDNGTSSERDWCYGGNGPFRCNNPTVPAGTSAQHTRILGGNYASCTDGSYTGKGNQTELFGDYGVGSALNLTGAQYVDVQCIEITTHNGSCIIHGSPAYPSACSTGYPLSNYASNGVLIDTNTHDLLLQDMWIHGFTNAGLQGPIGGLITMNRVLVAFNGFAGWNFDDGKSTPDAPGSSINASYVAMIGNGCNEEYPIVDAFPAVSCYDLSSGGFGDSWSGQETTLASFTCDHCVQMYNTKDGFIGPHTQITNLTITNSESIGNMGQQWKWGASPGSATTFENNLTVGNCNRLSAPLPGAPSGYNQFLSLFCRAAGDMFSFYTAANSNVLFANNTTVGYSATMFDFNCQVSGDCGSATIDFENNIMLGFLNPRYNPTSPQVPGLYYFSDASDTLTRNNNLYYNLRNSRCPTTGYPNEICADPLFVNEPAETVTSEAQLDNFDFNPSSNSLAIGAGVAVASVTTDYNGVTRPNPPSIGALEYGSAPSGDQITLNASPNPAILDEQVTLTATVAQTGRAVPTGNINFLNGNASLGTASLGSSGAAILTISTLPVGSYAVVAAYSGDSNYPSGESGVVPLLVLSATTTRLVASPNPVTADQTLALTATVIGSGTTTPSGTVNFLNGSTVLGTATLNASGVATLSTASLAAGTYSLTAEYTGNASFLSSTSAAVPVTVNAQTTAIIQSFSLNAGGSTPSQTVQPGGTAVYTLGVSPAVGTTLPAITFVVSGLPAGATATFSPQTIPAGSGATNDTLSIQTSVQSAMLERNRKLGGGLSVAALGILLLPFGGGIRRSGKRMLRLSYLVLLLAGAVSLAGLTGCAVVNGQGEFHSTSAQTYTVTVTSTAASLSQTTTVTLIVE